MHGLFFNAKLWEIEALIYLFSFETFSDFAGPVSLHVEFYLLQQFYPRTSYKTLTSSQSISLTASAFKTLDLCIVTKTNGHQN